MENSDIAIIGLSGRFPGAENKDAYWRNITQKTCHLADAPAAWTGPYYDPEDLNPRIDAARMYTRKVGLLGELRFNPLEFGIPPSAMEETDPEQFLALQLARDALWDAGYDTRPFDRERVGVIVGRGANPHRADVSGIQYGMVIDQTLALFRQIFPDAKAGAWEKLRAALKRSLPTVGNEHAPLAISNVLSGRIANRLDLMGPNYLVDGACASGLIAADLAMNDLMANRCDMVLAGAIQTSMSAQIYMLFSTLGALSPTGVRPFDAAANGTLLSEGAGFVLLKRLSDAIRDGDRVYAVIKGIGMASDGKAQGLLAPRLEGEALALRRAYEKTGIDPATVDLIEAHGTGIPLGDQTEIQALTSVFGPRTGRVPHCALGSVKSMIGHCIPAAGIASLIKVVLSLHYKTLPPTLCETVHPELGIEKTPFYINTELRPWIHGGPALRRAGIDAFGFGGINAHAILEEFVDETEPLYAGITASFLKPEEQRAEPSRENEPEPAAWSPGSPRAVAKQDRVWASWPTELVVLSAIDRPGIAAAIGHTLEQLENNPSKSLANLGHDLSRQDHGGGYRLAIVARDRRDLAEKLSFARKKLADEKTNRISAIKKGIYYGENRAPEGKIAFIFSSEGSQYPNMLADLCLYFPKARGWFGFLDDRYSHQDWMPSQLIFPPPTGLTDEGLEWMRTQLFGDPMASESVTTASYALYELLCDFGVPCDMMAGHSCGEHVALRVSGKARTRSLARFREELQGLIGAEANPNTVPGALLSLGALPPGIIEELQAVFPDAVYPVADNCPSQMVLFCRQEAVESVVKKLRDAGAMWMELPFHHVYHTPLYGEEGIRALDAFYKEKIVVGKSDVDVYSCSTGSPYPSEPAAFRKLAVEHWITPVRFRETIERVYEDGARIFVEVGAGNSLTAFTDNILKGKPHLAVPTSIQGRPALEQFQHVLGILFTHGVPVRFEAMYEHRRVVSPAGPEKVKDTRHEVTLTTLLPRIDPGAEAMADIRNELLATLPQTVADNGVTDNATAGYGQLHEAILSGHYRFMQEFLENQARVAALFGDYHDA